MLQLLVENPLLTLMVVVALGYFVGRIRIGGFSLGVAAVLFAGMGVSAFNPHLALPEIIYLLGLALFVYTIGLAAGPGFFSTLRQSGLRYNALAGVLLVVTAAEALGLALLFGIKGALASGMYAGAFTNTPALAGVLDTLQRTLSGPGAAAMAAAPVVGYSLAYPIGVLGVITAISLMQRLWKINYQDEAGATGDSIEAWTVRVLRDDLPRVQMLEEEAGAEVKVSRLLHGGTLRIATMNDKLQHGDLVKLVGAVTDLKKACAWLGERLEEEIGAEDMTHRRLFVSSRNVAGRSLGDLALPERYGFAVTRIWRGDMALLAHQDSVLELGDRVQVVVPREKLGEARKFFGDSYKALSEMDVLTFAVGLSLGLLLGMVPFHLPGGGVFRLGSAGGPLLVGLVLGALGRTGRLLWQLPYGVNLTLRQVGVVLFLAGIGTRAGGAFAKALSDPVSLTVVMAGAILTFSVAVATLVIGHKMMKAPFGQVAGILAGVQTQPAVLAFVNEQAKNDLPNLGYTTVYPLAMVGKIILAQLLLILLTT